MVFSGKVEDIDSKNSSDCRIARKLCFSCCYAFWLMNRLGIIEVEKQRFLASPLQWMKQYLKRM